MENAFKDLKGVQGFKGLKMLRSLKRFEVLNVSATFYKFNLIKHNGILHIDTFA